MTHHRFDSGALLAGLLRPLRRSYEDAVGAVVESDGAIPMEQQRGAVPEEENLSRVAPGRDAPKPKATTPPSKPSTYGVPASGRAGTHARSGHGASPSAKTVHDGVSSQAREGQYGGAATHQETSSASAPGGDRSLQSVDDIESLNPSDALMRAVVSESRVARSLDLFTSRLAHRVDGDGPAPRREDSISAGMPAQTLPRARPAVSAGSDTALPISDRNDRVAAAVSPRPLTRLPRGAGSSRVTADPESPSGDPQRQGGVFSSGADRSPVSDSAALPIPDSQRQDALPTARRPRQRWEQAADAAAVSRSRRSQPLPRAVEQVGDRVAAGVAPVLEQAYAVTRQALDTQPAAEAQQAASSPEIPGRVSNTFNVNVSLAADSGLSSTQRALLEQAVAEILRIAARRQGLEV